MDTYSNPEPATKTGTEIYRVITGATSEAMGSLALSNEFVVGIVRSGHIIGFLERKNGGTRYFGSRSGARKAITRQLRGDFHR